MPSLGKKLGKKTLFGQFNENFQRNRRIDIRIKTRMDRTIHGPKFIGPSWSGSGVQKRVKLIFSNINFQHTKQNKMRKVINFKKIQKTTCIILYPLVIFSDFNSLFFTYYKMPQKSLINAF